MESATPGSGPPTDAFRIRRKPVSNPNLRQTAHTQQGARTHTATSSAAVPTSSATLHPPSYADLYGPASPGSRPVSPIRPRTSGEPSSASLAPAAAPPTAVQKAYSETRHFLGGLINHPTESNRHVTILRHSHGLVFYRGNATSVAVSIFSDAPLPPDRTLWLQNKGWSGKTGMRAKALFRLNDSWIDVTPMMPLRADQVRPDDERAWQRDIKKFKKKASPRQRDTHELRETAVVRIPAEAGDGYFQIVLCEGPKKKVLGNSPVFRVLSTSASPHSVRGASLSTLPLEVGAMVLSLYAQTAARTIASPAAAAVQAKIAPYQPSWLTQTALETAYTASGVQDRVAGVINPNARPSGPGPPGDGAAESFLDLPAPNEQGPTAPFPMTFKARGTPYSSPTPASPDGSTKLSLQKFPSWVPEQLRGYFFGWTRLDRSSKDAQAEPWRPSILSIRNLDPLEAARVDMSQVARRFVALRILDDMPVQPCSLEMRVMGFLRAEIPPPTGKTHQELAESQAAAAEAATLADSYDVSIVENTLSHPAWAPEIQSLAERQRQETGWKDRTREGYANILNRGHKLVDQIPLHRVGVRSATDEVRERQIAVNGFYIVR
ncbi:hypothetical protein N7468_006184 [Penicillium chermesinum]|uniref:LipA and NB-ARC domain protein n=1 Tax=Penicillium chermesinum TaxID=63820 RepID=A0A9W9TJL4_9EURO|nr:uncharacterized protein N7468_006184 [Penicillium chermesinum]KAJ5224959.1 hypothetical protein N7468_006184 [Penicillium chermesinum]